MSENQPKYAVQAPSLANPVAFISTISSVEIAILANKRHDHVIRDVRDQIYSGLYGHKFDNPKMGYPLIQGLSVVIDEHTKRTKEILLDRYHADILVSGYEVKYRAAIVKRWHELEAQAAFKVPSTLREALLLAADQQAVIEQQQAKIAQDAPKVAFADQVASLDDTMSIGDFSRMIGAGQNRFFRWLRANSYLMENNWPYQRYIDRGVFVVRERMPWVDGLGNVHASFQTRITGKGQTYLELKYRNSADGLN